MYDDAASETKLEHELSAALGPEARVHVDPSFRDQYARDLGQVPGYLARLLFRTTPDVVVQPGSTDDVVRTLRFARECKLPITPRGVASWGFGGAVPTKGGIVIDTSPLDAIHPPDVSARTIEVEGGAKWGHIDRAIESVGLALQCYPSSRFSTVAGWISTGGYGLTAFGRGHLKHSVAWVELVSPEGDVRRVTEEDRHFDLLFGSEGQLGIITRVCLKLEERARISTPHLFYGASREALFDFVRSLSKEDIDVPMVKYFDASLMKRFNAIYSHHDHSGAGIVENHDAILVQVDGAASERRFQDFLAQRAAACNGHHAPLREAPAYAARYIWHDRYNPLKIQMLGPSMLAGELVMHTADAGDFIEAAQALGRSYKLDVLIESHFVRDDAGDIQMLLIPMFLSDRRRPLMYLAHVTLVPMLTRLGVRMGGKPYGIGIWNTPFLTARHDAERLDRLRRWKAEVDPHAEMNPGKFWTIGSRFFGLTGLPFAPTFFGWAMDLMLALQRVLGAPVPRYDGEDVRSRAPVMSIEDTATQCTNCGNCVAVCPAYQVTKDERTTARTKLRLGHRAVTGAPIAQTESDQAWLCTRCGECERVCQSELPLLAAYEAIEGQLEPSFGRPDAAIQSFVTGLGSDPNYLELIESEPFRSV